MNVWYGNETVILKYYGNRIIITVDSIPSLSSGIRADRVSSDDQGI